MRVPPAVPASEFFCRQHLPDGRVIGGGAAAARLSLTPARLTKAPVELGSDPPRWS